MMQRRGGEESGCGSAGCPSRRAKCGCQLESNTMNIINEFKQLYEDKMRLIDEEGGSGDCTVQAKLNLQQDWIRDLTEQNEMLVRSVEELELEATERVIALEKKLKQTSKRANEVMNGYKDYSFDLEEKFRETERLRSDLTNLLTLLKTDCNGNKVNFDDYHFYTMDEDVVDQLRTRIKSNFHGLHANKALVELHEKEEEIRELEEKIKELKSAPTVVTTEYAELKQSMLDMRDALTAEVADKHDAIVALKRDVQMLEEQCRKADQQTHFKDDIIKELRKEIKQLRLERKEICASSSDCIKKQTVNLLLEEINAAMKQMNEEALREFFSTTDKECFEREKLMELEEENSELKEVIGKSTDNLAALEGKTEELISENCQLQECQLEYVQKIEILEAEKMELMNNCCQMQDKLERLSHTEEISIESENMIQTLRFELDDVRKKNEDCLCTIECLSGEKQEQCCKIESLEKCVKDLSKKIETKDTGVQWSRPSSPKGRFGRRRSPARSRSYDDEHEEREESVFTFDLSCTGNRDKKPSKRTRSKGRHRSRSKDDDHDDVDYDSLLEKSRYKTHHNIHDNRRYNDSDTANSEERSHHANQSNFHRNYKVSKRDGNRDNSRYYSSNHGSSREESDLEDDDDKMLIVRRKPSNTSLFDDDDFSEITKSHREPLYATKPDLDKRISFSDSADQQTDASSSRNDSRKIARFIDKKHKCQSRKSEELRQDEIQVAKRVAGHLAQKLQVHVKNSRSSCGSDQTLGDLKVVKLTAISTNAQPWCQLQGTVHEIKDSVSRIIVKENEVKLAHQRIAELEEQVQWISKKDEIIDIQNDTLNIVENELQAYRTMECEVEAARGCREREVCNLKQTIQTLLLNLNDEKQRSENLQRAVDLYLNSISVLESSESNLKREISEQKVTIGNLQDALVSVKQGLDEQRTRTDQEVGLGWASRWFGSASKQQPAPTVNVHKANNVHEV